MIRKAQSGRRRPVENVSGRRQADRLARISVCSGYVNGWEKSEFRKSTVWGIGFRTKDMVPSITIT